MGWFDALYGAAEEGTAVVSWAGCFDLVVEVYAIRVLTSEACERAIAQTTRLVAPGGGLLIIAGAPDDVPGQ
jgi:hypothetical protein